MAKHGRQILTLITALSCLIFDLLSKHWAHRHLLSGERHALIPGLLNLILVSNTGCAFSIGQDRPLITLLLSLAVFALLVIFYIRRYRNQHPLLENLGMAIILGAASGNLCERLCYGKVTDFLEFAFINFPVFNLADVLIDTGFAIVFLSLYWFNKK